LELPVERILLHTKFVGDLIKEEPNFRIHMEISSHPQESFALSGWILFSISCAVGFFQYIRGLFLE
jgi:hypothetical protein